MNNRAKKTETTEQLAAKVEADTEEMTAKLNKQAGNSSLKVVNLRPGTIVIYFGALESHRLTLMSNGMWAFDSMGQVSTTVVNWVMRAAQ